MEIIRRRKLVWIHMLMFMQEQVQHLKCFQRTTVQNHMRSGQKIIALSELLLIMRMADGYRLVPETQVTDDITQR